jgi:hypothetical protein
MTRHQGWDVHVAPDVPAAIDEGAAKSERTKRRAAFAGAMDRLGRQGTRTNGVKKMKGLDLWELRIGDTRVFFIRVTRSNLIAVGAIATKRSRRMRMSRLQHIERVVHEWGDRVEKTG